MYFLFFLLSDYMHGPLSLLCYHNAGYLISPFGRNKLFEAIIVIIIKNKNRTKNKLFSTTLLST
jgi:hypothetical protein